MIIVLIRTVILYSLVVLVMRLMGKRQVGELQPYEYVITIMISDLAALPMQDTRLPLLLGIIPIVTLLILKTFLSELQLKSKIAREIIDGKPSLIIENGKINMQALRDQRINIDDLFEELRLNGYLNISDIQFGILENNGQISIFPKASNSPVTREDMKIKTSEEKLPILLFLDGKVNRKALKELNKSEQWLEKEIKTSNITSLDQLYLAMLDSKGKLFIQTKSEIKKFSEENL